MVAEDQVRMLVPKEGIQQELNENSPAIGQLNGTVLECDLCQKSFSGVESKEEHLKSKKHLIKMSETSLEVIFPNKETNTNTLECKICDKIFSGIESKEEHLKSKKHLKKCNEE